MFLRASAAVNNLVNDSIMDMANVIGPRTAKVLVYFQADDSSGDDSEISVELDEGSAAFWGSGFGIFLRILAGFAAIALVAWGSCFSSFSGRLSCSVLTCDV